MPAGRGGDGTPAGRRRYTGRRGAPGARGREIRRGGAVPVARTITLNGKRIVLEEDEPTGEDVRKEAGLDDDRLLIDGETRQIIGPDDPVEGDDLYDAPRFSKGAAG